MLHAGNLLIDLNIREPSASGRLDLTIESEAIPMSDSDLFVPGFSYPYLTPDGFSYPYFQWLVPVP